MAGIQSDTSRIINNINPFMRLYLIPEYKKFILLKKQIIKDNI